MHLAACTAPVNGDERAQAIPCWMPCLRPQTGGPPGSA